MVHLLTAAFLLNAGYPAGVRAGSGLSEGVDNIVLIGWDGVGREYAQQLIQRRKLPALRYIARSGSFVTITCIGATDTKAGWAEMLSGYGGRITGIVGNHRSGRMPAGLSVFERVKERWGGSVTTGAIISKNGAALAEMPQRLPAEKALAEGRTGPVWIDNGMRVMMIPGAPYESAVASIDVFSHAVLDDEVVCKRALDFIEQNSASRFFLFVHFGGPDNAGHNFGEGSREYRDAIVRADRLTGAIIRSLSDNNLMERTALVVASDHGFDKGRRTHEYAPDVFMAINRKHVVKAGLRPDVGATILALAGIAVAHQRPVPDGQPLVLSAGRERTSDVRKFVTKVYLTVQRWSVR